MYTIPQTLMGLESRNPASGKKSCSIILSSANYSYKQDTSLDDAEACQELCQSEAKCEYWSFDLENSECHLMESKWTAEKANGAGGYGYWASGPAFCPRDYTDMDVNPDGFSVTYSSRKESIILRLNLINLSHSLFGQQSYSAEPILDQRRLWCK